ncbi:MAG: aldehyde dehydrogenase family protein [Fimbriimonadales bacterium]|nr:aldehyde dehydrogenase family protein [Fimbriimonadales bacterium]MDW8052650.1 aldehyde dehydrogenase family protein [Armatimonadota bacterium]
MQKMLIGGHLVGADEWLPVHNPYTGEPVDYVARGGAAHVDQAVALARHGAELMRAMPLSQRAAILRHVAELIRQERHSLAALLTQETGKLIGESRLEVERAAMVFELAAAACRHPRATQFPPESFTDGASRFGFWVREPLGVVASILAFNLPLAQAAQKAAPAIAAGNAIILKPSTEAPLAVLRLGLLLYRAGVPPEALSVLTGKGEEIGHALAAHPALSALTFTGSREVGLSLPVHAGVQHIEMELDAVGGLVATESAEVEQAADAIVCCGYMAAGQLSTSIQHVWAHERLAEPLTEALVQRLASLRCGDPMDEATTLPPLIHERALQRVARLVQETIAKGARALIGACAEPPFYMPTVLVESPSDSPLHSEAVFGPVVLLHRYSTLDELVAQVNALSIGLRVAIFTRDLVEAFEFARRVRALSVHINDLPVVPIDPVIRGDIQEHHMCFEDMLQRIDRLSRPKFIGFGKM